MNKVYSIIGAVVGVIVLATAVPILYPLIIDALNDFSTLGNFTFSGLFNSSTGITTIILSAGLLAVLIAMIVKAFGKGKR